MVTKYKFHRRFYSGDGNFPVGFEEDEGTVIPVPQKKSKSQNGGTRLGAEESAFGARRTGWVPY